MAAETNLILIIFLIVMAVALAFSIGSNDETLASLIGAGVLKFKVALILGGIALGAGMIIFSGGFVPETVGRSLLGEGLSSEYTNIMLLTVLISSIIWLVVGSFAGIPLSSTHALIGSIFGVVIVYAIFQGGVTIENAFNYTKLGNVVLSWFISPISGLVITFLLYKLSAKFFLSRLKGLNQIEKSEKNFKWLLLVSVIFAELWVGANSGEALGILLGLRVNGSIDGGQYITFAIFCAIFAFLGIYFAARYVIRNLASHMIDTRPSEGFIIQMSSAFILMIATLLALPISHSHVIVFCIFGMSIAQKKEVDYRGLGKMGLYWVLTFPIAALLSGFLYFILSSFGLS
ncbi:MAG: anion permease [Candidatus Lokiarchaeota archaeon]|nr:anion permease [Candidatus Lokiarchaeota archaeon]